MDHPTERSLEGRSSAGDDPGELTSYYRSQMILQEPKQLSWEYNWLVGGWATPLKNMKVNWNDYYQYMGK